MRTTVALLSAACLAATGLATAAGTVVTVVQDPATLLRSAGRFSLAEGVRLQAGDAVEVGDNGLVQMGFADGARLSLGPQSRVYLAVLPEGGNGALDRGARVPAVWHLYLLHGWAKLAQARPAAPLRLAAPLFELTAGDAIAVLNVQRAEASLFVEKGELRIAEALAKASAPGAITLRAGQFYARKADHKGVIQPRPAPAFVAAMPAQYQDNLPTRLPDFQDREVAPRRLGDLAYADVEPWLKGPPELRRQVMQRLRMRARDPAFRQALIANMPFHPEWNRILFPGKHKPKAP